MQNVFLLLLKRAQTYCVLTPLKVFLNGRSLLLNISEKIMETVLKLVPETLLIKKDFYSLQKQVLILLRLVSAVVPSV